jgi:hypothetical protein
VKAQEQWDDLIEKLLPICDALIKGMSLRSEIDVPACICHALFQRGADTLRAIQLLYKASLPIQAQVLIRVLIEVRMDLEIFLRLCAENPEKAARRVIDAMMLEKVKQQRESDFRGLDLVEGAPTRDEILSLEKSLVERYGRDLVGRMRRHGFSGQSVEDRARQTGLSDLYHVVYRNFSRNVHATDYMEHFRGLGMAASSRWASYEDLRDHVALSTAITCLWQMASLANYPLGCELGEELKETWKLCVGFEHWVHLPPRRKGSRDPS